MGNCCRRVTCTSAYTGSVSYRGDSVFRSGNRRTYFFNTGSRVGEVGVGGPWGRVGFGFLAVIVVRSVPV